MEKIGDVIIWLASLMTALTVILSVIKRIITRALEPLCKRIEKIDENQCKTFLVDFLSDVESGIKKDEVQIKRAYEVYEHYTEDLHKNSYIHDKWERLMK
jgi:hypothetical protein